MKQKLVFLIPLLLFATELFAQQNRFDEATNLLEEQRYADAIESYKSIADDGHVSGALWLNLGVAYAHLDSLGKAKYYLMRSAEFPETESMARESLDVVENRFSRRSAVLPMLPWDRFFQWADEYFGSVTLLILGLILLNVGAGFVLAAWFRPGYKKPFKYLSITSGALAAVFMSVSLYVDYQNARYETGVTIDRQSSVYSRPDTQSAVEATAYEGYTMRVDLRESESEAGWFYIRLENGRFGWIEENAVLTY
ncbi:SH3 domain-containing protein [Rhodohalobacter sp. SW132]|uniref:SH3 domain-containing protein n=1 Tax=Rhodohalobacter sp. SW132 TaxID=2293433 RepID=UPI000E2552B7|nr:SH3 domain-containing protein [Rhodohalobacter sp. SW132]REL25053.1 SH3 domain-containing protein [Rhodohalobacter sp. SW132]